MSSTIPNGSDSGFAIFTLSKLSKIGLNFVIAGPMCSAIQMFSSLSIIKANGSASGPSSGVNSMTCPVTASIFPSFPTSDSANQTLLEESISIAVGPASSVNVL